MRAVEEEVGRLVSGCALFVFVCLCEAVNSTAVPTSSLARRESVRRAGLRRVTVSSSSLSTTLCAMSTAEGLARKQEADLSPQVDEVRPAPAVVAARVPSSSSAHPDLLLSPSTGHPGS